MTMAASRPVERSVFRRFAVITTTMALAVVVLWIAFFALTVVPHFSNPEVNRWLRHSHFTLILPTVGVTTIIILVAHVRVLRLMRPLRGLAEGVTRVTDGDLDAVVETSSRDEFATLTNGFNQMVARVREMIGARDQLLLDVSHELRSPITRMKVALELLPESDVHARLAADVREMEMMVTELLELERLRDGRTIRRERVDVATLTRTIVASFDGSTPGVRLAAGEDPITIDADGRMLGVVLRNLVDNAVTHSLPDSGPVTVGVSRSRTEVTISVTDDGPGIPESEAAHVFEPFYRVDRSRSRRTGGYGLGLSICKRVIDAHGGRIDLVARHPRGTSFVVTLPLT
jgi:signal transduction histidine kinase